jgi:hypothetical protein
MLSAILSGYCSNGLKGHSQHILHRLHYVRGTEQEAKDACRSHHSDNLDGGDLTSVEDIVGSIRIYWRDIQCLNNFEAVYWGD